jgi:glycosyltransferase involved in cell wall biosynthesis
MSAPEISVVIPTCNRPEFLRKAISSVAAAADAAGRPGLALEIVIADDGHSAASKSACEEMGATISYALIYLRTDAGPYKGPGGTRNQGVRAAKGQFVYLLDDDDQFLEGRFKRSLPLLRSGNFDAVFERTRREFSDGSGRKSYLHGPDGRVCGDPAQLLEYMLTVGKEGSLSQAAVSFTKKVFESIGGVDESLRYAQDGEFLLRIGALTRVAMVGGEPVAIDFIHGHNHSRPQNLSYYNAINMLRVLYNRLKDFRAAPQRAVVRHALAGKLDLALTRCRVETDSYAERLLRGIQVLQHYPWSCLTRRNIKSIAVWLSKGPYTRADIVGARQQT